MKAKVSKLKSGLTIVTDTNKNVHSVVVSVGVKAGGRDERSDQTGIAHLLEHMAFKGTTKRTCNQIVEEVETLGGHMNAYTSKERTVYYIKILKEHAELAIDVLSDILQDSIFPQEELDKERHVVVQEIKRKQDNPGSLVYEYFQRSSFPDQQMGKSILGTEEEVLSYTRDNLLEFVNKHYHYKNMVVSVSGNIKHSDVLTLVKKYFTVNKNKVKKKKAPTTELSFASGTTIVNKTGLNQANVIIGYPTTKTTIKEELVYMIIASMLGQGMTSRLFREIREKRGLVYSVGSYYTTYRDAGVFSIHAGTTLDKLEEFLTVTNEELKGFAETITKQLIQDEKAKVLSSLLMETESITHMSDSNIANIFQNGNIITSEDIKLILNDIDKDLVKESITNLFSKKSNITILANEHLNSLSI